MRLPCRGEYASAGSALLPRAGASDQEPQRPRRDGMLSNIEHHPKKRGSGRSAGGSQWEKDDLSMVEDWLPCNRENSNDTLLAGDFRPKGLHHHRRQTRNEKQQKQEISGESQTASDPSEETSWREMPCRWLRIGHPAIGKTEMKLLAGDLHPEGLLNRQMQETNR